MGFEVGLCDLFNVGTIVDGAIFSLGELVGTNDPSGEFVVCGEVDVTGVGVAVTGFGSAGCAVGDVVVWLPVIGYVDTL